MSEDEAKSWYERFIEIYKKHGWRRAVPVAGLFILAAAWWNWDKIEKLPGVTPVVEYVSRERLPHAEPTHFAVAIAHLDGDTGKSYENVIHDALDRFAGLYNSKIAFRVLRIDQTISLSESDDARAINSGHDEARRLLKSSGADILIWGKILRNGTKSEPRLFWTAAADLAGKPSGRYPIELELPGDFWKDLTGWLGLLVEGSLAEYSGQDRYVADRLKPVLARIRALMDTDVTQWESGARQKALFAYGYGLAAFGEQAHDVMALQESAQQFEKIAKELEPSARFWTLVHDPTLTAPLRPSVQFWALTQNSLGVSLARLGEQSFDDGLLFGAAAAFRAALRVMIPEQDKLQWASTQNNLGNVLCVLAFRGFEEYVYLAQSAYEEALLALSTEKAPLLSAEVESNLAGLLGEIGIGRHDDTLYRAISCLQPALHEYSYERTPLRWADTQYSLGRILENIAYHESGANPWQKALAAFQQSKIGYERAGWRGRAREADEAIQRLKTTLKDEFGVEVRQRKGPAPSGSLSLDHALPPCSNGA
jgi:hypothetical protein